MGEGRVGVMSAPAQRVSNTTPPLPLPIKGRGFLAVAFLLTFASPAAAQDKQPPYWASIASGQAMTRTGPARTYPGVWLYQRRDLPVRVVKKYQNWRLIQDPDGDKGWMLATLLSDRRTPGRGTPSEEAQDRHKFARNR